MTPPCTSLILYPVAIVKCCNSLLIIVVVLFEPVHMEKGFITKLFSKCDPFWGNVS